MKHFESISKKHKYNQEAVASGVLKAAPITERSCSTAMFKSAKTLTLLMMEICKMRRSF